MTRVFITGSTDGLGLLAAQALIAEGHEVVLHARNEARVADALEKVPEASHVVTGDLSDIEQTKALAAKVNALGRFDTVIHNAGVFNASRKEIFAVNTLAPYILTCLIEKPKRLIYLSSDMHLQGRAKLEHFKEDVSHISYADTKLHVLMLCKAVAARWPHVYANAVNPGWVPTRMGGRGAPDSLEKGYQTQVKLAVSEDKKFMVSGTYFFHQREAAYNPEADNSTQVQQFISLCGEITGITFLQ